MVKHYLTVTLQTAFLVPHFAVIFAVPFFLAVTFPVFAPTLATVFLEEEKVTVLFVAFLGPLMTVAQQAAVALAG